VNFSIYIPPLYPAREFYISPENFSNARNVSGELKISPVSERAIARGGEERAESARASARVSGVPQSPCLGERDREGEREGARERGSEGARERGSEGARERGSEGARELYID
jgi:hypothetical protein